MDQVPTDARETWSLEDRATIMVSNWLKGKIPFGLIEDILTFAALFGAEVRKQKGMDDVHETDRRTT